MPHLPPLHCRKHRETPSTLAAIFCSPSPRSTRSLPTTTRLLARSLSPILLDSVFGPFRHPASLYTPTKMAPKKVRAPQEAAVSLGPNVAEGENVFGVAHIFAS